jgi:hypothetical protein
MQVFRMLVGIESKRQDLLGLLITILVTSSGLTGSKEFQEAVEYSSAE